MPSLSIVVPVFKVERFLDTCVQSLLHQPGFDDYEVILVDDGSPDSCPALCDRWAESDSRIRVIHKSNGGLSDARNAGIDAASGAWLMFVDSDDRISPDTLSELMAVLRRHPEYDMLEFPFRRFASDREWGGVTFEPKEYRRMADYWLDGRAYQHSYAWNKVYRRCLFDRIRYPKGRVFEDIQTLPLLLKECSVVAVCPCGMYYYRVNPHGITITAGPSEVRQLLEAHAQVLDSWYDGSLRARQYYLHVANIQILYSELSHTTPIIPDYRADATGLGWRDQVKSALLNLLGLRLLCRLNTFLRRYSPRKQFF